MLSMIVFKVITISVLIIVVVSPVLSQNTTVRPVVSKGTSVTTPVTTVRDEEVDCTDLDKPMDNEVYKKKCAKTFCQVFSFDQNASVPKQWSNNFANGVFRIRYYKGFKQFNCKGIGNDVFIDWKWDGYLLMLKTSVNPGGPAKPQKIFQEYIYYTKQYVIGMPSVTYVRQPETEARYLNTTYVMPKLNTKGLLKFEFGPKTTELLDPIRKGKPFYSTSFQVYARNDPLFGTLIMGQMTGKTGTPRGLLNAFFPLERYLDSATIAAELDWQPTYVKDSFDITFNPKTTYIILQKHFYICLGRKSDKFWTAEGCRAIYVLKTGRSKEAHLQSFNSNHKVECLCDFVTLGAPSIEQKQREEAKRIEDAMEALKKIEVAPGFNRMPNVHETISSPFAYKFWSYFGWIMVFIALVIVLGNIGFSVYFIYYARPSTSHNVVENPENPVIEETRL